MAVDPEVWKKTTAGSKAFQNIADELAREGP